MTAKEYLQQAFRFNQHIKSEIVELDSYRELARSINGCRFDEHLKGSKNTSAPFVSYTDKAIDLEEQIKKDKSRLCQMQMEISEEIDRLEDVNERLVLRYRYLMFMSWDEVAAKLAFTKRWVFRLHDRAIFHFEQQMEENRQ